MFRMRLFKLGIFFNDWMIDSLILEPDKFNSVNPEQSVVSNRFNKPN